MAIHRFTGRVQRCQAMIRGFIFATKYRIQALQYVWEQEERRLRLFLDMVVVFRADFPSLPRHNPAWYPSFYAPNYLPTGSLEMMAQAVVLALEQVTGLE
ncbi:unnamed protein product, partial [Symbiodinium sp. KB8]